MKAVYYSQHDDPQASYPYPAKGYEDATGKSSGCGPTCFAMVYASFGGKYTPVDALKDSLAMGTRVSGGTSESFFAKAADKYNLAFEHVTDHKKLVPALKSGKLVICHMEDWFRPGVGHFIVAWGVSGDKVQINDPASRANTAKPWEQSVFLKKCIRYFIFGKKEAKALDWKEILKKVAAAPEAWEKAINTAVAMAKAEGNMGDMEIFANLPLLIEKIYNSKG